jgi:hypothetical protein
VLAAGFSADLKPVARAIVRERPFSRDDARLSPNAIGTDTSADGDSSPAI